MGLVGGQLLLHFSVVRGEGTFLRRTHTRFILFFKSSFSDVGCRSFVQVFVCPYALEGECCYGGLVALLELGDVNG